MSGFRLPCQNGQDKVDSIDNAHKNAIEATFKQFVPYWEILPSPVQSVVVRDAYDRFMANTREWHFIGDFVRNYLEVVKFATRHDVPQDAEMWRHLDIWGNTLIALNQGR